MKNSPTEPIYFVPIGDPIIESWKQPFEMLAKQENHTLVMDISPESIENMGVATVQEFVMVLQHYSELIDKFMFSLKLKFLQIADSELYF